MQVRYPPDEETEAAREGTAAHWTLEQMLAGTTPAVGTLAANGVPVDEAMIEAAEMLVDDVTATLAAATPGLRVLSEQRVAAATTVHADNWGTCDAFLIDQPRRVLHVWDFKYGHKFVGAYRNWQLIDYAAAILESAGVTWQDWPQWTVTMTVVQPRNYSVEGPVREWHCGGDELVDLVGSLGVAARAASMPDAPCRTGEHCHNCSAAFDCAALADAGGLAIDTTLAQQPLQMTAAQLGLWARTLARAYSRLKALQDANDERILGLLRAGQSVPGWAVGYTRPRETWTDADAAIAMGDMMGADLRKPGIVTPPQAVKLGIDRAVIDRYAHRPAGSAKLVESDETQAARVFGQR